ncbi:MAG: hypothetical protein S0880_16420 [Actinomycetota bacterium]|nr:hypothetical protein [Actinomycetota bacterium]
MADGILFERAGVPAVPIITSSFELSARAMAKNHGFPGYEYAIVPHPVASVSAAQLRALAHEVAPRIIEILGVEQ